MIDQEHPDVIKLLCYGSAEEVVEYVQVSFAGYYSRKLYAVEDVDPLILRPRGHNFFHLVRQSRGKGSTIEEWFGFDLPSPPAILPGSKPPPSQPRFPSEGHIEIRAEPTLSVLLCAAFTDDCRQLFHSLAAEIVNLDYGKIQQGFVEGIATSNTKADPGASSPKTEEIFCPRRGTQPFRKWQRAWRTIKGRAKAGDTHKQLAKLADMSVSTVENIVKAGEAGLLD